MRVALNGWFWEKPETGCGQYVRRLTYALSAYAPESEFFVLLPGGKKPKTVPSNIQFIVQTINKSALHKVWWEQVVVPQFAQQCHADILHIPYWAPPLLSKRATVVTVHDLIPLLLPEYRVNALVRLYTAFVSATSSQATMILTDSRASLSDIQKHLHIQNSKIRAIHLALDDTYHHKYTSQDSTLLQNMGLQTGYILYLGGFDKRKNLKAIITAFKTVKLANEDAVLVIAGRLPKKDTNFTPDPRRLAADAELTQDDVRFPGFVPESVKPALYRGARLFVFPSRYEGFGYPPLEALTCGIPVVGSSISSLPEVIGNAGVLFSPDDIQGLASAMIHILIDDTFHSDLHFRAIEQATRFSWESTAQQTYTAYRQALDIFQT